MILNFTFIYEGCFKALIALIEQIGFNLPVFYLKFWLLITMYILSQFLLIVGLSFDQPWLTFKLFLEVAGLQGGLNGGGVGEREGLQGGLGVGVIELLGHHRCLILIRIWI